MSKRNKKKISGAKLRSAHAVGARLRGGAGKHQDKRFRRKRTRASQKRAAINEF